MLPVFVTLLLLLLLNVFFLPYALSSYHIGLLLLPL